ncbi:AbrB/MazE/SpoVT family DNA-binding domain-containing protein [Janibacter terrae]|jgi:AbrB family looped-hinge helix DNA binding protein|uniref:AbrB/MazE/SpoVT family DNA-binding domain-containing protein n=1 Tax=Janibacter terrae TaxID=103817 RepID=A0ABZ2FF49_9MICO|nr:AbrB/MazE/SpoVT family DNA-binding domain-containing protein [Janibacter terrae]MBA4085557.1 AbrB/MazE/SpoVT family DNA-binding domain-containing protein [Kytococcus sp.]
MSTGTMTSKGQITIPKDVREQLGLTPGTKVTFTRNADGDFVLSTTQPSLKGLRGRLRHVGPAVSLETMDDAIAAGATEDS